MKILPEMYRWTKKSLLNFRSHSDLYQDSGTFKELLPLREKEIQQLLLITDEVVGKFL